MTFEIPPLTDFGLVHAMICSSVDCDELAREELTILEQFESVCIRIRPGGNTEYLRCETHSLKRAFAIHIELAMPDHFDGRTPKLRGKRTQVASILEIFSQREARVSFGATAHVDASDIAEGSLVKLLATPFPSSRVTMRMIGGKVEVLGSAVKRMTWDLLDDTGDRVALTVSGGTHITISPTYLTEVVEFMRDQVQSSGLFLSDSRHDE